MEQQHARGDALIHDARPTPRCRSRSPTTCCLSLLKSHNGRSCGAPETTTSRRRRAARLSVAAAQPEVLPWKAGKAGRSRATRLYTPLPNSVVSTEPLPGRMAIGGPKEFPPAVQAPLIPGTTTGNRGVGHRCARAQQRRAAHVGASRQPAAAPRPRAAKKSAPPFGARHAALQSHAEPRRRLLIAAVSSHQSLPRLAVSASSQRKIVGRSAEYRQHDQRRIRVGVALPSPPRSPAPPGSRAS